MEKRNSIFSPGHKLLSNIMVKIFIFISIGQVMHTYLELVRLTL